MVVVEGSCCLCSQCYLPTPRSSLPPNGAAESHVVGEEDGVEYELNDFLLLGDFEGTFGTNTKSLTSPNVRQWLRTRQDDDVVRGGTERRRTASLLKCIDSDLVDETLRDDDFDGPSGIRDSWTSTLLGRGRDEEGVDHEEDMPRRRWEEGCECANDDSRDDGSASPNRVEWKEMDEEFGRGSSRISLHHREKHHRRQHSDASSTSTQDEDKVFKHHIAQRLARNKRDGGGGVRGGGVRGGGVRGGGDQHGSRLLRETSKSLILSSEPSTAYTSPTSGRLPRDFSQPPLMSMRTSAMLPCSGEVQARTRGENKDPPAVAIAAWGVNEQRRRRQQRPQRRQPPRPDVVRYHCSGTDGEIHSDEYAHDDGLSRSPDMMLSKRGRHFKQVLLDSMASSSSSSSLSSPHMSPPSSSAMMACGNGVESHPRGTVPLRLGREQGLQQLGQLRAPRTEMFQQRQDHLLPITGTASASSSTLLSGSYCLDNSTSTRRPQACQERFQTLGDIHDAGGVFSEQSEQRRRRYKELLLQRKH
jgi:hypothetical protein